jgi:hypothetical protein
VAWEEFYEVFGDANGAHAGAPAAVRDAEGLVEIEMANVGPDVGGTAQAHLGVHVCPIHINLAAIRVNDLADLFDRFFENAVR